MPHPVILVLHDPAWMHLASQEISLITRVLGQELIAIHHVGSTSIPGLKAKPILDLLGVVNRLHFLDENAHLLERIGYRSRGESGIPGRRYFSRPQERPHSHHLHFFEMGDPNINRLLFFRDYLLAYPEVAVAYERLKEQLAAQFPDDSQAYTDGKTAFIQEIVRKTAVSISRC